MYTVDRQVSIELAMDHDSEIIYVIAEGRKWWSLLIAETPLPIASSGFEIISNR